MSADKAADTREGNMVNFVILLECFGICLTIIALLLLLNGEGAKEQKLLILIMCGTMVQNIGYLLELTAPTVEARRNSGDCGKRRLHLCTAVLLLVYLHLLLYCSAENIFKSGGSRQLFYSALGLF